MRSHRSMRSHIKALLLWALPLLLVGSAAGGEGITSVPISAIGDAAGHANLSWTATSTDAASPKCGHAETVTLGNDSSVNVHADSSCSV